MLLFEAKTVTFTTDDKGYATIPHSLGIVPDAVGVTPVGPAHGTTFFTQAVVDEFTKTSFRVQAFTFKGGRFRQHILRLAYHVSALVPPTPPPLPTISLSAPSEITQTSAVVSGRVHPDAPSGATYHFEYGKMTWHESMTSFITVATSMPVSETLTDLEPGTKYFYRLVAINVSGTVDVADSFTTMEE